MIFFIEVARYIRCAEEVEDDIPTQSFVKDEYGAYQINIGAQIEHSYYHLGKWYK